MKTSPFFSIVMPVYNVRAYIIDALKCERPVLHRLGAYLSG